MVPPAFLVNKGGSPSGDQSGIDSATPSIVTWDTIVYDYGSCFSSSLWTPNIPGKVSLSARFYATGVIAVNGLQIIYIYKNNNELARVSGDTIINVSCMNITAEDICNGTTDYYSVYAYITCSTGYATISGQTTVTSFCGHWFGS